MTLLVQSGRFAAAGGGTYTLYPVADSGYLQGMSGIGYAGARSGSDGVQGPSTAFLDVGQVYSFDPEIEASTWVCMESFITFDLSTVTGTVSSAALSLGLNADFSDTDFTVEARTRDYGATLTTADYVAGASLSALTLLASLATSGIGATGAYKAMTENGSNLRNAITGSTLRLLLCSSRQTGNNEATGSEFVEFYAWNHATLKPKLVVVTT